MGEMQAAQPLRALGQRWTTLGDLPRLPPPPLGSPPQTPPTLRASRLWFWGIELSLILAFFCLHFSVWDLWRNGERFTGVVVDLEYDAEEEHISAMTIRDPATELEVTVHPFYLEAPAKQIGDTATAVVMPGDPPKADLPADLDLYVACWAAVPLLAVLWPVRYWRRRNLARHLVELRRALDRGDPPRLAPAPIATQPGHRVELVLGQGGAISDAADWD